jgi:hypothetical protein
MAMPAKVSFQGLEGFQPRTIPGKQNVKALPDQRRSVSFRFLQVRFYTAKTLFRTYDISAQKISVALTPANRRRTVQLEAATLEARVPARHGRR